MEEEIVKQLNGIGELYEGDACLGPVRYSVSVIQEYIPMKTQTDRGSIPGTRRIEGQIWAKDDNYLFDLGGQFTLHLEGNWRWECFLKDNRGTAVNTGKGLYQI